MSKRIIKLFFIIMIVLCLAGCISHEQTEDIIIMYTNDVAGELNGELGIANVKGYKNYLMTENNYVTLVDAGDYFDGNLSKIDGGGNIVKVMNAVGYDVVALGNQEFSIGLENLANNIDNSDFDYISCNLKYTGSGKDPLKKVKPYVIKKYGWTKVAYIGVTTPETTIPGKSSYEAILKDGKLLYGFYEENEGQDLYEQVQKNVNKVRKKVDYVVVLAHLGSNSVSEGFSSYDLIENTEGIDVVIDGHSHTVIHGEPVNNRNGDTVVLTSTGHELENFGVLYMHPDHTFTTTLYPSSYETDLDVQALVDSIYEAAGK